MKVSKHHEFIVHFGGGPSKLVAKWTMETTAGNKENESTVALMLGHANGLNDRQAFDIKDVLKVSEEQVSYPQIRHSTSAMQLIRHSPEMMASFRSESTPSLAITHR